MSACQWFRFFRNYGNGLGLSLAKTLLTLRGERVRACPAPAAQPPRDAVERMRRVMIYAGPWSHLGKAAQFTAEQSRRIATMSKGRTL